MTDILVQFFTHDVVNLLVCLALSGVILGVRLLVNRKKLPVDLFVSDIFMLICVFTAYGLFDSLYSVIVVLFTAGLITHIFRKTFGSESSNTNDGIMLSFVVFFGAYLFLAPWVLSNTSLNGSLNARVDFNARDLNDKCVFSGDPGFLGIGLISSLAQCAYNFLLAFLSFSTYQSDIFILNTILIGSFLVFLVMYIITKIKPASG